MTRALRIELRRSTAPVLALAVLTFSAVLIVALGSYQFWGNVWISYVTSLRGMLIVLCPLAVGAGALQAAQEHRRGITELFTSTPLPRHRRVLPTAVALGLAAVLAYLVVFAAGSLWMAPIATYANVATISAVVAVGALAILAAVLLGAAAGHLLPSRLTPPISTVLTLLVFVATSEILITLNSSSLPAIGLLLPDLISPTETATKVPAAVSAWQAVWFLGVALAGLCAFAAPRGRTQLLALVPLILAAVLVVPQLPQGTGQDVGYALDADAASPVCTSNAPQICVTQVHSALLPQITGPARRALGQLDCLPQPPTTARQFVATDTDQILPPPSSGTLWLEFGAVTTDRQGRLSDSDVQAIGDGLVDEARTAAEQC